MAVSDRPHLPAFSALPWRWRGGDGYPQGSYWSPASAQAYGFNAAYTGSPGWDIGRPQRAFARLVEEGRIRGRVLDVGCGTGELSLYLAREGHDVLGVDFSPLAVQRAREKARWRGVDAHFLIWDALDLGGLAEHDLQFDTAVDSAMFHCLNGQERRRVVAGLERALRSGGSYYVLCAAAPDDISGDPGWVSATELRELFRDWEEEFVRSAGFETRYRQPSEAYLAGFTRP